MNRSSYHGKLNPSFSGDESTAEISLSSINTDSNAEHLYDRFHTSLDFDTHNPILGTTSHSFRARRHLEAIVAGDNEDGDEHEDQQSSGRLSGGRNNSNDDEDDEDLLQESFAFDDNTSNNFGLFSPSQIASSASLMMLDKYVSDVEEDDEEDVDLVPSVSPSTSSADPVARTEG